MALHGRGCARAPRLLSEGPEPVYPFLVFAVVGLHWVNVGGPMRNAVESLELAERLASSSDRRRMLKLAEAGVELANGTHDRGCHPEHSGDPDQPFQAIPITHSDRSRSVWRGVREGSVGCIS